MPVFLMVSFKIRNRNIIKNISVKSIFEYIRGCKNLVSMEKNTDCDANDSRFGMQGCLMP